ncbi:hypothetical protein [Cellulomonas dongxiuzhuiae]|uniref:hypothetical protein n=1 Tax=Cellulomonas dongxiuzhuiae TaxID=2819979 RepID=UPI001AAEC4ED|nr:hypothetical protein [Cellulomonas dongxiuzhuiae]MBO3095959.1 hypothetical protein [Cellulomonas dongxiuzhuiae]
MDPYAELAALDLDIRLAYFEETFGVAKSAVDVCADGECLSPPPVPAQLVIHETDDVMVRALFADDALAAYTVTTKDESFTPPVRWIGMDLGPLGTLTTQELLDEVEPVAPDGVASVRHGMVWLAYVDVFVGGAPADYRGLVLAWTFDGAPTPIDTEVADGLMFAGDGPGGHDPLANAEYAKGLVAIRGTTVPNTYGEYRDDGPLAQWLHDPENVHGLLFEGSEY